MYAEENGRHENRKCFDLDATYLGGDEMPKLVNHDHCSKSKKDQQHIAKSAEIRHDQNEKRDEDETKHYNSGILVNKILYFRHSNVSKFG